mgnify:CR=1 FL=1
MIKKSHTYLLYGKLKGAFGNYTIQTPEFTELFNFDIYNDGLDDMLMFKTKELEEKLKFYPIYGLTKNITQNFMRRVIFEVLKSIDTFDIIDIVPKKYKKKRDLLDIVDALYNIHMPKNEEKKLKARETLVYEEFLKVQTALLYIKGETKREKGIAFRDDISLSMIIDELPFKLTGAQLRTLEELERDLEREVILQESLKNDCVIATGGGSILDNENIKRLKETSFIVFLNATIECLYLRLKDNTTRPILNDAEDKRKLIEELLEKRKFLYQISADYTVDINEYTNIYETVDKIKEAYIIS